MKIDVYEIVTKQIIEILESGAGKWEHYLVESARASGKPVNLAGRPYNGINNLVLSFQRSKMGFRSPRWGTFKQISAEGGSVLPGSKGTPIIFFKINEYENTAGEEKKSIMARYYTVFNLDQTTLAVDTNDPVDPSSATFDSGIYFDGMKLNHVDTATAYYSPGLDAVTLPLQSSFVSASAYFSTLVHEASHWTGHESRLNRSFGTRFGSHAYAIEELTAELATCFFAAATNTEFHSMQNSAAYLSSWLAAAKKDSKALVSVASAAQKACELLVSLQRVPKQGCLAG